MAEPHGERPPSTAHVHRESIEVGELHLNGDHLTASLRVVVCGRKEALTLVVKSFGEQISVQVYEAVLDYAALAVVAECVAARLRCEPWLVAAAAIGLSSGAPQGLHMRGPQVIVDL